MSTFNLKSQFKPTKDQLKAINHLTEGVNNNLKYQVLLGVTGSGKTFTMANVIKNLNRPTLIISHNKTLAAQLYQEFRDFFPDNAVSYFVSYYDYYQPEAYIPSTDTYIEKDSGINEMIDKLRLASTTNLLTRNDTIVVASVSCIYNIGSPKEYGNFILEIATGVNINREQIIERLIDLQYERGDFGFHRGTFRVVGNSVDIYPAYLDIGIRIELDMKCITSIGEFDPVTGQKINLQKISQYVIYPAKHYITDPTKNQNSIDQIVRDLNERVEWLKTNGKELEAHRLKQKTTYDLQMIKELGYVKGIENYSRYFDGRKPGDPPYTLLDYFNHPYSDNWLVMVDESHITFPQIRGMYQGDQSRKKTLVDYGFRLPASMDNRPLMFEEFMRRVPNFIATSATPSEWELNMAKTGNTEAKVKSNGITEQLIRPTGIPDPEVEIRPINNQVQDVIKEVKKRAQPENGKPKERSLITTLTKRSAEDLSNYLDEQGLKVHYIHSDVKTLERTDILDDLRSGKYDCIVGVNLLREGLDLPEVTLVAILDADKEGFLRSEVSLTQTMGRAARNVNGRVILYANTITKSMERALSEIDRRRKYQIEYNKAHGITPTSIQKPIRSKLIEYEDGDDIDIFSKESGKVFMMLPDIDNEGLTPLDTKRLVNKLRREMKSAAQDLNFELAAEIRDKIIELEG